MENRVCIFVDGENFRHSILELFETFRKDDYLPHADWSLLFDWLASRACHQGLRKRTYWYVIENIDFFPYTFPDATRKPEDLKRLLTKDKQIAAQLAALTGTKLTEKMQQITRELIQKRSRMKARFEGWRAIQDGIALKNPAVTFKRAGGIRYNLFTEELGDEKAVDVKLACDMVVLKDMYDVAVVVSGDQDYVPAVEVIKEYGKSVTNVAFKTRGGRLLPGGARRLSIATDRCLEIGWEELAHYLEMDVQPNT